MSDKVFSITTPIYYINSTPHIGHAYTQIAADARARFERMRGRQVYFLTGTDEHGAKVARAAKELGRDTQEHANELSAQFRALWDALGISYDDFIRTTEPRHTKVAQRVVQKLWDGGHLRLGTYSGWYSVPDETFFRPEDVMEQGGAHYLANPTEDQSRAPLEWVEETTHFLKLSAFEQTLKDIYATNPEILQPSTRRNEALSFINSGLNDTSISRELDWGIAIPSSMPHAENHSIYVWFEALLNYISAPGYLSDDPARRDLFDAVWPCDVQLMSKDIFTRFHATLWPSILTALELPLPKQLFAHGFWTVGGRKMSKRDPETIVEPIAFAQEIAARAACEEKTAIDALRYYCLREVTFGSDGDFSREGCVARFNSDLANGWGNLVNRALAMLAQYFESTVPAQTTTFGLKEAAVNATSTIETSFESLDYSNALESVWGVIALANRVIEEQKPWAKIKEGNREEVGSLIAELLAVCEWTTVVLAPVMPHVCRDLRSLLNISRDGTWASASQLTIIGFGHQCQPPRPLFPRIKPLEAALLGKEKPKTKKEIKVETVESAVENGASSGTTALAIEPGIEVDNVADEKSETKTEYIEYADFAKVQLRTAIIVEAERVPKADKLLRLQVDVGQERRQILAGIAQQYEPEQLIGKTVVIVANLAPRKLRGFESQGMLLAASISDEAPASALLTVDSEITSGSIVR
ncbi:MAG TPA: methionine--tRNA ligase [Abditibacteriaceae bacterium]|jgi:methionyl-tRNA synthetase